MRGWTLALAAAVWALNGCWTERWQGRDPISSAGLHPRAR